MCTMEIALKIQRVIKLHGFSLRRELCIYIGTEFEKYGIDLNSEEQLDKNVSNLVVEFQKHLLSGSIEKESVSKALDACLSHGTDKTEVTFNLINFMDFPRLAFDLDRKVYIREDKKPRILSSPRFKASLYVDRYSMIFQRTQRNFKHKTTSNGLPVLKLQTVDYLLTSSNLKLENTLILGSLLMVNEGQYHLEDPTGMVLLDLRKARYQDNAFFVENSFVLVNGCYEDKVLLVSSVILPPGEEYKYSRLLFGNMNYFGGESSYPLRTSVKLNEQIINNHDKHILFFCDVWLDHSQVFEKLKILCDGIQDNPPVALIFMGNFTSESHGFENMDSLRQLFGRFANLINKYSQIANESEIVFVPGLSDPCQPHVIPRLALPSFVVKDLIKACPKTQFATNPCRIQYYSREIVVFRSDVSSKLIQASLCRPNKENIGDCVTRTIISQGTLSPLPINALPIHWDFDYTLNLFPLPNLIVLGDKTQAYTGSYKDCQVTNPGSFGGGNFQFQCYYPANDSIDNCVL